jgi:hypothetical protein
MASFTTRIQTKDGAFQFYFNRIFTTNGVRYHISVMDRQNKSHVFYMELENGSWHLVDESRTPDWIVSVQSDLQLAIINH